MVQEDKRITCQAMLALHARPDRSHWKLVLIISCARLGHIVHLCFPIALLASLNRGSHRSFLPVDQVFATLGYIGDGFFTTFRQISRIICTSLIILSSAFSDLHRL